MRATPLKAAGGSVAALVRYYEGKARDSAGSSRAVGYYADPDEPPGRWWGSGCDEVGLAGEGVPGVDQALAWVEARRAKPAPRPEARI